MFIETIGAKCVLKFIQENGCVVVTGSSGTGKSSLVRHVALRMQEIGYDILPLTNPEEIIDWYNPRMKILFVVDDFCGIYTINPMKFESWKKSDGKNQNISRNETIYKEEIDKLQTEGAHGKYCALALCVMFDNRLKEELLTKDVDKDVKKVIKNTYEACKVMKGTSRLVLRDELDSLTHTFMKKDGEKELAGLCDIHNKTTPIIQCSFKGDIDLVTWCLYHCISSVNDCRNRYESSPLYFACQEGHTDVVQMLITNKADINKSIKTGESPVYIACYLGHTEVCQMLINNNADINKCNDEEV
ncbi:unnamed protein product [Mytilus coruscus]|uniref:Novel STAND NTPase 3 domain-containing protein n=1 Tax=Mytilus coruscus TaxID=42192 RepID=A0A6J8CX20_MYTCO|nr:unnamed protein product [Mytilus coruscus]